jgi:DNA invertase Pin-like site-specific DNA recombinase
MASSIARTLPRYCTHEPLLVTLAGMECSAAQPEHGLRIAARYVENESGAELHRPELFRLLTDCEPRDVLLVEQVDRLSRLTSPDWIKLRTLIDTKQVRVVALDLRHRGY